MLYGEGAKAFLRLQEEIIKQSDDHTIFAWPITAHDEPGLPADSPDAFATCARMEAMTSRKGRSPYSLTNRGLSIVLTATPFMTDTYLVRLECVDRHILVEEEEGKQMRLGMFLRRLDEDDQFIRVRHNGNTFSQAKASFWDEDTWRKTMTGRPVQPMQVYVRQKLPTNNP